MVRYAKKKKDRKDVAAKITMFAKRKPQKVERKCHRSSRIK